MNNLILAFVALIAAIVLHELTHAIAAYLLGVQYQLILKRSKYYIDWRPGLAVDPQAATPRQLAVIAASPLVLLVAGGVALFVHIEYGAGSPEQFFALLAIAMAGAPSPEDISLMLSFDE